MNDFYDFYDLYYYLVNKIYTAVIINKDLQHDNLRDVYIQINDLVYDEICKHNLFEYNDANGFFELVVTYDELIEFEQYLDNIVYNSFGVHYTDKVFVANNITHDNTDNRYKFIEYNYNYYELDKIEDVIKQVIRDYNDNSNLYFELPLIYEYSGSDHPMTQEELDIYLAEYCMYIQNDGSYTSDYRKADNYENRVRLYWKEKPLAWIKPTDPVLNNINDSLRKQYSQIYNDCYISVDDYYAELRKEFPSDDIDWLQLEEENSDIE